MGSVIGYFVRRIGMAISVLIGSTLIAFLLGVIAPGDPAREALSVNGIQEPTEEEIAKLRHELGLDRPLIVQYGGWIWNALQGDFGKSYITNESVLDEIILRLPVTLNLALWAVVIAALTGIPIGIWMGAKRHTWIDHLGRAVALLLVSVPGFLIAIVLIMLFAELWGILPTSGYGTWQQMILPASVLASGTAAILMRLSRAVMLEVMNEPYILTARAKGLSEWYIIVVHALRNMLVPLITVLGTYFGGILGGAVIVEVIFALPGVGRFAVDGIYKRDYPVIQGYVLFTTFAYVFFNLVTDLLYVIIHPQVRLGGKNE